MKKPIKYLRYAAIALVGLAVLLELCIIVLYAFGGYGAAAKLPLFVAEISNDSMYPQLRTGDCVLGATVPFSSIREGDTITYAYNGQWITHRVIRVNGDGSVTTKGLANVYEDGNITEREYIGKIYFRLPLYSTFLAFTEHWTGKLAWILLSFLLCFGYPVGMWVAGKVRIKGKYVGKYLK